MSELKRVAFTTLTNVVGVGGGGGGGGGSSTSILADGISSNSKKGTNFNCRAAAALLEINRNENASSSPSSSTAMLPPPSLSSSAGLSSLVAVPSSDSMTSRQQASKTIRLELQLFEPDSDSSPEFNYLELIKIEKKKIKKLSRINGFCDPFEENDDEVARIAKEFEKKYGGGTVGSGKRRTKKDDLCDKGAGYDESDSFIDNTEAYDEIIPDEVETVEGGFYINSGALEFKHLSNYEKQEDVIKMNKTKKRTLSTSSSSSDDGDESNEAEEETEGNSSPRENSTLNSAHKLKNGHIDKKQKNSGGETSDKETGMKSSSSSSSSSLKYSKDNKQQQRPENSKPKLKDDAKIDDLLIDPVKEKDKEKTVKTTTVKDMLKAKRDNFRKMQEGENKLKLTNGEMIKGSASNKSSETSGDDSDDSGDEPSEKKFRKSGDDDTEKIRVNDVKLPDSLNEELIKDIEELKEIGKSQIQSSKSFQFDEKVADVFLRIDDACLCLDKSARNLVFAHIEYQLSLSKYYLLRKAKQLRIKQEKTKIKKAFTKLKKAVLEIMPSVLLQYEGNCNKIDEIRSSLPPGELEKMEYPPKYPKKKFPWNEYLRNLLYDLYQVRWMSYTVLRTRKEAFEDFVNNYFKEKVVLIWPSGWMRYEDLKKELERRKMAAKKPKDKKPPIVVDLTLTSSKSNELLSTTTLDTVSQITKSSSSQPLDLVSKSILSTSNSLSVVSTKDLVLTIATTKNNTTTNNDKLSTSSTEVPCNSTSAQSISSSIIQVPPDSINLQSSSKGMTSKDTSPISSHHKSPKSSSGSSISSGPSKSPSPSHLEHNHMSVSYSSVSSKTCGQNLTNYSSSKSSGSKLNADKSGGGGNNNNSSNSSNNNNVNSHHKMLNITSTSTTATTNATTNKGPLDLVSPTKRSTDHSINSIISSQQSLPMPSTTSKNTSSASSPSSSETATTHIITVDNLKNTTEIIKTTNKLLSSSNGGGGGGGGVTNSSNPTASASNATSSKEGSIRIRSFANVSNAIEVDQTNESNNCGFLKPDIKNIVQEQDSSSESDGVEIVGVYPAATKKPSISSTANKGNSSNKSKKSSKVSSRSDSPITVTSAAAVAAAAAAAVQNLTKVGKISSSGEIKDAELDVNQIMKALKELEEMQQSSIHITNSSPPSSSSSSVNRSSNNTSHASPISYGKDIKQ